MTETQARLIDQVATSLEMDSGDLVRESLSTYLALQLRRIEADIQSLKSKYAVESAAEIDARYREGTLPEEGTWEDFFKLDHLEYRRKRLLEAMSALHEYS